MATNCRPLHVERALVRFLPFQKATQDMQEIAKTQEHNNERLDEKVQDIFKVLAEDVGHILKDTELPHPSPEEESVVTFAKIKKLRFVVTPFDSRVAEGVWSQSLKNSRSNDVRQSDIPLFNPALEHPCQEQLTEKRMWHKKQLCKKTCG